MSGEVQNLNRFNGDLLGRVPDVDVKVSGSATQIKTDTAVAEIQDDEMTFVLLKDRTRPHSQLAVRAFILPYSSVAERRGLTRASMVRVHLRQRTDLAGEPQGAISR